MTPAQVAAKETTPIVNAVAHQRLSFTQEVPVTGFGWEKFGVLKQVIAYIIYFIFLLSLTPLATGHQQ